MTRPVICRENSAPSCSIAPQSLTPFIRELRDQGGLRVADVGAGRLRATRPLLRAGFQVWIVETPLQLERTKELVEGAQHRYPNLQPPLTERDFCCSSLKLDGVTTICVLHTIPEKWIRCRLLRAIRRNMKPGAKLLIDVPFDLPYYRGPGRTVTKYRDGYLMGGKEVHTFFKEFSESELVTFVKRCGFKLEHNLGVRRHHAVVFTVPRDGSRVQGGGPSRRL